MPTEIQAYAKEQTKSLEQRLALLYLREKEVQVDTMVENENGELVAGKETLYLLAPTQRQVLAQMLALRNEFSDEFDAVEGYDVSTFDFDRSSTEEAQKFLIATELETKLMVRHARICCEQLKSYSDTLLEHMLVDENQNLTELGEAVNELCAKRGVGTSPSEDPFLSQKS